MAPGRDRATLAPHRWRRLLCVQRGQMASATASPPRERLAICTHSAANSAALAGAGPAPARPHWPVCPQQPPSPARACSLLGQGLQPSMAPQVTKPGPLQACRVSSAGPGLAWLCTPPPTPHSLCPGSGDTPGSPCLWPGHLLPGPSLKVLETRKRFAAQHPIPTPPPPPPCRQGQASPPRLSPIQCTLLMCGIPPPTSTFQVQELRPRAKGRSTRTAGVPGAAGPAETRVGPPGLGKDVGKATGMKRGSREGLLLQLNPGAGETPWAETPAMREGAPWPGELCPGKGSEPGAPWGGKD